MKIPFFASFIVFLIWLSFTIFRVRQKQEKISSSFWNREIEANSTRRKPLDNLKYISIPFDLLPMSVMKDDEKVQEYQGTLYSLSQSPIVNFTGYTNTDLKLEYGAPNIEVLISYDQNYTTLVRTLQQWAAHLFENGFHKEARCILEFSISTDSDVSTSYKLLSSIYREEGCPEKIEELMLRASHLKSVSKNIIVRILQESDQ